MERGRKMEMGWNIRRGKGREKAERGGAWKGQGKGREREGK